MVKRVRTIACAYNGHLELAPPKVYFTPHRIVTISLEFDVVASKSTSGIFSPPHSNAFWHNVKKKSAQNLWCRIKLLVSAINNNVANAVNALNALQMRYHLTSGHTNAVILWTQVSKINYECHILSTNDIHKCPHCIELGINANSTAGFGHRNTKPERQQKYLSHSAMLDMWWQYPFAQRLNRRMWECEIRT